MRILQMVLAFVVLPGLIPATNLTAQAAPDACQEIKAQMRSSHIPDVALAIFRDDQVELSYCSMADHVLASDSVFQAASLSKPVFAIGVLTLARNHEIDLDRALISYLNHPYKHQQRPFADGPSDVVLDPRIKQVTARMVLSHTSGMPNWSRSGPLTFQSNPGQRWSYSAEGYVYLQRVVESITGRSLDTFLKETVLEPLGMTHSSFVWEQNYAKTALQGHASSGDIEPVSRFAHPLASSTLYTTLGDYARFVSKLLLPQAGSAFSLAEMRQVIVRPDLKLAWGLGLAIEDGSPRSFFHWGANPGFQSFFLCQPKTRKAVLFLTDSDNGLDLLDAIVNRSVEGVHPALRFPLLHPKD